jgi:hypothetical protein
VLLIREALSPGLRVASPLIASLKGIEESLTCRAPPNLESKVENSRTLLFRLAHSFNLENNEVIFVVAPTYLHQVE